MKKPLILVSVLIIMFCLSGSVVLAGKKGQKTNRIKWLDYKQGMLLAEKQNKRVYLHFYTDWCNYCDEMEKTTLRNPAVVKLINEGFVAIRVNTGKDKKVASRYNVRPVPDNWFLSADGKKLRNFLGYYEADQFVTVLRYVNEKL
ncbi:MAG: thioredoxin family protein [Desulfobacterales bacterium]